MEDWLKSSSLFFSFLYQQLQLLPVSTQSTCRSSAWWMRMQSGKLFSVSEPGSVHRLFVLHSASAALLFTNYWLSTLFEDGKPPGGHGRSGQQAIYRSAPLLNRFASWSEGPLMSSARRVIEGCLGLLLLVIAHKGRFKREYWRWRQETAFGVDGKANLSRGARWKAILAFGQWSWRLRKL